MLPYEILVGLRGTMCTCARGFISRNSLTQFNFKGQSLHRFSTISLKISNLEQKCKNVHMNNIKRFHTNLLTNCQASPNDSKTAESNNIPLKESFDVNDLVGNSSNASKSTNSDIKSNSVQKIPENVNKWIFSDSEKVPSKDIEKLFLEPKMILHNVYAIVQNEMKITKCLTSSSKHVNVRKKGSWSFTYEVKWPENLSFTTVSHSKSIASTSAALKCLYWLYLNKKVKNRMPVLYEQQEQISLLKAPEDLKIDANILDEMSNFVNKYKDEIETALSKNTNAEYVRDMKAEWQHPVSYMKVDIANRHQILAERLKSRPQISNTELPIFQFKSQILQELEENQAVVIKGDTGCGKTTQVPQFIIDHLTEQGLGGNCSMVVTQPRRISAISLAERVAFERNERVGDVIGYQVRLQQVLPKQNGGILFCTTGVLLKKIQSNPNLEGCSHVIVDEAHERSIDTDMLLVLLKRAIQNNPKLRVVIMSATINADLFQNYLNCNAVDVPGRLFPVKMHLLDDMYELKIPMYQVPNVIETQDEAKVNSEQVTDVIKWIDKVKPPGAILCFLPGWGHIQRVQNLLEEYDSNNYVVIPLHSKIPYLNQSKVFQPPPQGKRKIILSTDVAETGITVPDVVYVIDSACHKEVRWHENKGLSSIDTRWISRANLNQRKGRAGRVQEGESYHFLSRKQYEELEPYPLPEVLRVSLEKTVLDCKTYSNEKVENFLSSMPQPPRKSSVQKAVEDLQILGALDSDEDLTPLGKRIALFTIHPRLSKALVYSAIFQCLSPVATVAAALSLESEIFYGTLDNKSRIRTTKTKFHPTSDHLAISWIYEQWLSFNNRNRQEAYQFCRKYSLHTDRISVLDKIREINLQQLREANMILDTRDGTDLNSDENEYAILDELVRGVLLAGMDQVLKHRKFEFRKGRLTKAGSSLVTEDDAKAQLSTECVNYKRESWPSPFLIYFKKTHHEERRTTLIRESSMLAPITVILFSQGQVTGTKHKTAYEDGERILLEISGKRNVQLACDRKTAEIVLNFRDIMWSIIQYYVENNKKGGILDDRDDDTDILMNAYKKEMMQVLLKLLSSSSESIDSIAELQSMKIM